MLVVFFVNGMVGVGNALILFVSMITVSQALAFLIGSSVVVMCLATSGRYVPFRSRLRLRLHCVVAVAFSNKVFLSSVLYCHISRNGYNGSCRDT
jgi:uncharacterized membrane protein YfcA